MESTRFVTFQQSDLFPDHTHLVADTEEQIITCVHADGSFHAQKRVAPEPFVLIVHLLGIYPDYALTGTLLATLLDISEQAVVDRLLEAEKQGEREALVIPLRTAISHARRYLSAFNLTIGTLPNIGYKLLALPVHQREGTSRIPVFASV